MSSYYDLVGSTKRVRVRSTLDIRIMTLDNLTAIEVILPVGHHDHHSHEYAQIGMVLEGRMLHKIGDESAELGPGDMYRVPSNVPHESSVPAGGPPTRVMVCFYPPREDYLQAARAAGWDLSVPPYPSKPTKKREGA